MAPAPSLLLPIALLSIFLSANHDVIHGAESDALRLDALRSAEKSSTSSLLSLSTDELRSYIEKTPRSYSLIVMFSADSSICQPCSKMRKQVEAVAREYAGLTSRKASSRPVFFAEVKLSTSDKTFLGNYDIRHVPIFYHFASGKSRSYPTPLAEDSPDSLNVQKHGFGANALKQFINGRTGSAMKVIRGGYEVPFVETVRSLLPYIVTVALIAAAVAIYTGAYKSPMLWFGLVVLVYIFSVGGGHYSWIHNTPFVVVDNNGKTQYISGGNRSQYVAEGFFVSFTCVCISGLVILIQELPKVLPHKNAQTVVGTSMVFMTICAIAALLTLYQFKMPSYLQYSEM